jgi:hypothetical protein
MAGCKASSYVIVKQLADAVANVFGSEPRVPPYMKFEERAQFALWASYFGEHSLCPVAHIGEGELYRGASGQFYYHACTLVYVMGFTVEQVCLFFTDVAKFKALKPTSIFDLKARYEASLSKLWIERYTFKYIQP